MTTASTTLDRLHVVEYQTYREIRVDRPVIMLHGIGGSAASCASLAECLAASGIPSWCVDAPGYGASPDPLPGVDAADEVIALIDNRSPGQPVVLLGTSWGGVIATAVALRRPERVAALILADSTRGSGTTAEKAAAMRARIDELGTRGAEAVATERAPRLTAPHADPVLRTAVRRSMAAVRENGFRAAAEFMASTDHGEALADIECPTLVIVGEHDRITGVDESRLLADRIPGAELAIIADAGHVAIQERPRTVAERIVDFVGGLS